MHYIYVILNKDKKSLYVGYANDIDERIKQHRAKNNIELIYYEAYKYEKDARDRERKLKLYGSTWRGLKQRLNT
jgi:predicted GIY-YIG superfamily endonuclease